MSAMTAVVNMSGSAAAASATADAPATDAPSFNSALEELLGGASGQKPVASAGTTDGDAPAAKDDADADQNAATLAILASLLGRPLPATDAASGAQPAADADIQTQATAPAGLSAAQLLSELAGGAGQGKATAAAGAKPATATPGAAAVTPTPSDQQTASMLDAALEAVQQALAGPTSSKAATPDATSGNTATSIAALTAAGSATVAAATAGTAALDPSGANAAATQSGTVLHEPVGSARWAQELGNRLVLMSVRGQHEGSLTLTPEHLGPVEVRISVSQDTANVWFGAQHAETRTALAEAMPRLRELFAASGMSLGQAGVSQETPRRSTPEPMAAASGLAASDDTQAVDVTSPVARVLHSALLDTYA